MPRVFGAAPIVGRSTAFVEHLDLFPTLVELAMGAAVPRCPAATHENRATLLCTEGLSFAPLLRPAGEPKPAWKAASFSQFPRYGCWAEPPAGCGSVMGYSMRRHSLRYTEWVAFNTSNAVDKLSGPDWAELVVRLRPVLASGFGSSRPGLAAGRARSCTSTTTASTRRRAASRRVVSSTPST